MSSPVVRVLARTTECSNLALQPATWCRRILLENQNSVCRKTYGAVGPLCGKSDTQRNPAGVATAELP